MSRRNPRRSSAVPGGSSRLSSRPTSCGCASRAARASREVAPATGPDRIGRAGVGQAGRGRRGPGGTTEALTTSEKEELVRLRREIKRVTDGARHPKKSHSLLRQGELMRVRVHRRRRRRVFRVELMCRVLEVSASGYYGWPAASPRKQERERRARTKVEAVHQRVARHLRQPPRVREARSRRARTCRRRRLPKIMQEEGAREPDGESASGPRPTAATPSASRPTCCNRDFTAERPTRCG